MNEFNLNFENGISTFDIQVNGNVYSVLLELLSEIKPFHHHIIQKSDMFNKLNELLKFDLICKTSENYVFCLTQEVIYEERQAIVMKSLEVNVFLKHFGITPPIEEEIPVLNFDEFEKMLDGNL